MDLKTFLGMLLVTFFRRIIQGSEGFLGFYQNFLRFKQISSWFQVRFNFFEDILEASSASVTLFGRVRGLIGILLELSGNFSDFFVGLSSAGVV